MITVNFRASTAKPAVLRGHRTLRDSTPYATTYAYNRTVAVVGATDDDSISKGVFSVHLGFEVVEEMYAEMVKAKAKAEAEAETHNTTEVSS